MYETASASKSGLTGRDTRVNGVMAKLMARANCTMPMVTFMKVNGSMTKQTVKESTLMRMEPDTRAPGKTINSTVTDLKPGLTMLYTRVNTLRVKRTVMGS